MVKVADLDVVFIAYDEPQREPFWVDLTSKLPRARRVQGVKGMDRCFKAAAELARTEHFITVDADCIVDPAFADVVIDDDLLRPTTRLDWPSRNAVNGVVSGNGAVKCWPGAMLLELRSHESADPTERSIDHPRATFEDARPMATMHCNGSPLQAFRCAFREAIRLWVKIREASRAGPEPDRLPQGGERRPDRAWERMPLHRLLLWCSVGADVENGVWCLYGARLASDMLRDRSWDYVVINDFDWLDDLWREEVAPRFAGSEVECPHTGYAWDPLALAAETSRLGRSLRATVGLELADLTPEQSRLFRRLYEPPVVLDMFDRLGTMLRRGVDVAKDEAKSARWCRAAAHLGHGGAMYNLAHFALTSGRGARGIALLREGAALGSAHAAHRLGRLHRLGRGVPRDPARAVALFHLATELGFNEAHHDLAEMYAEGDGVARDADLARDHRRAAEGGADPVRRSAPDRDLPQTAIG